MGFIRHEWGNIVDMIGQKWIVSDINGKLLNNNLKKIEEKIEGKK